MTYVREMKCAVAVVVFAALAGHNVGAQNASFQAPTDVWAAQTSPTDISLSWKRVPRARYYRLFALDANGIAKPAGEARSNSDWWVHAIGLKGIGVYGQPLHFVIEAVSEAGSVSPRAAFNEVVPVKTTPATTPGPASAVATASGNGQIIVTWDAVSNATAFSVTRTSVPGGTAVVCRLCQPTQRVVDVDPPNGARVRYRIFGYTPSGPTRPAVSNEVTVAGVAATIAPGSSDAQSTATTDAPRGTLHLDAKPGDCLSLGAEGNILMRLADGSVTSYERVLFRNGGARPAPAPTFKQVAGVTDAVAVATSGGHSLALRSDGTILAWGENSHGQIGSEAAIERRFGHANPRFAEKPVPVNEIGNAVAIATGGEHSVALLSDGTIRTWGIGVYGVPGDGVMQRNQSGEYDHLGPSKVVGITNAVAIDASGLSTFALLADGTIRAWGSNTLSLGAHGTLGTGNDDDVAVPTAVKGITNATAVVASGGGGVALLADGTLRGWGVGYGTGHRPKDQATNTPVPIEGVRGVIAISPFMALLRDGTVREFPYKPSWATPDYRNVVAVASDGVNRIALLADGRLMAWGLKQWYPTGPVMRAQLGAETAKSCAPRTR